MAEPAEKEVVEPQEKVEEPQYTEAEVKAMNDGWVPKDQWEGDPDDWVPARQFLKNGELFGRINSYKHKIQGLEKTVQSLVKHNESVYDAGYKAAEAQLKAERRDALREGDAERVEEIEEQMEELKEEHQEKKQEFQQSTQPTTMHPAWEPWVERNSWYVNDRPMRAYADGVARDIVDEARSKGASIEFDKLLTEVGRRVKEQFANKFDTAPQRTRQTVKDDSSAGASTPSRKQTKLDDIESSMTPMEVEIMNTIVRSGVSKDKYLQDYKRINKKS